MIRKTSLLAFLLLLCASVQAHSLHQRHFRFTYAFTVRNPGQGKPLRVWFPMAVSDPWQDVEVTSIKTDLPVRQTRESEYGDRMFYASTPRAEKSVYRFEVVYDVLRKERAGLVNGQPISGGVRLLPMLVKRFLQPDRLVPVTGKPAEIAAAQVTGQTTPLEKAHAIYEYVFRTMRYDKSGTGWGRGDALWACDAHHGNCTDFHSLFASMARSQQIPVRFAIGFALPEKHEGEVPGYHCWADFFADHAWIPVDISEAWQNPTKENYFFGHHDENRVQFSVGRDINLNPRQVGEPLNYFVYPYVESDGKHYENVSNDFSFADVSKPKMPGSK